MTAVPPPFAVISGTQVQQALEGSEKQVVEDENASPVTQTLALGKYIPPFSVTVELP